MSTGISKELVAIRQKFDRFAEEECKDVSPFYYDLSKQLANAEDLLALCRLIPDSQPVPNLFLAAVHLAVLQHPDSELASCYPSVTGKPGSDLNIELLERFVQQHQSSIAETLQTRLVQTNVLTRCNYLLPVFAQLLSASNQPSTLIDIGASSGLNLNFDRYAYYLDGRKTWGDSPVQLHCQLRGGSFPAPAPFNPPVQKIGIDQNPVNLNNEADYMWLQALIWPDQLERFTQMREALRLYPGSEIRLVQGDSIDDFKKVINEVPPSQHLILYATHVLYQFPDGLKQQFYNLLDAIGQERDFHFLSAEATSSLLAAYQTRHTVVTLTRYAGQRKEVCFIAETNGHGNWIRWK